MNSNFSFVFNFQSNFKFMEKCNEPQKCSNSLKLQSYLDVPIKERLGFAIYYHPNKRNVCYIKKVHCLNCDRPLGHAIEAFNEEMMLVIPVMLFWGARKILKITCKFLNSIDFDFVYKILGLKKKK
jgi:hypothetical protein